MARRKRRKFNPEFKAEAVRLARVGDRSIAQIATDLDLTESALRNWVQQADLDAGQVPANPDSMSTTEKAELAELRREVKKLRQERDILKRRPLTSPRRANEIRVHPGAGSGLLRSDHVPGARCLAKRLLRLEGPPGADAGR
jgi:transposase